MKSYKYNINSLLAAYPGKMGEKEEALAKALGVSRGTIQHYRRIKSNNTRALSSDQLVAAAAHFSEVLGKEITVDELLNVSCPVAVAA